jgi:hypothetical protein
MPLFTVSRGSTALSTSNDYLTVVASSTKPLRIYVVDLKGNAGSSAANEVVMYRSSSGTTPGGAITPVKVNTGSAIASFLVYTTWSGSQPTLGDALWRFEVNANGGIDKFVAIPGAEIPVPVSGQVSIRSVSGTSLMIANLLIEEVDG